MYSRFTGRIFVRKGGKTKNDANKNMFQTRSHCSNDVLSWSQGQVQLSAPIEITVEASAQI